MTTIIAMETARYALAFSESPVEGWDVAVEALTPTVETVTSKLIVAEKSDDVVVNSDVVSVVENNGSVLVISLDDGVDVSNAVIVVDVGNFASDVIDAARDDSTDVDDAVSVELSNERIPRFVLCHLTCTLRAFIPPELAAVVVKSSISKPATIPAVMTKPGGK